jgi:POT family proton-dependent oligopeptide transporter
MTWSAARENGPTTVSYAGPLPASVPVDDEGHLFKVDDDGNREIFHQGRLTYDPKSHEFHMQGVLSDLERDAIVGQTAPADYVKALKELQKQSKDKAHEGEGAVKLAVVPLGFDLGYSGLDRPDKKGHVKITFDRDRQLLETHQFKLEDKDVKALLVAGGDDALRRAMDRLYVQSSQYRVSSWWLFWFYVLTTVGELCLSPIGLSMVSKLAPARFATMLMGLWMLTSFFGNFIAGALGEQAGVTPPITYFLQITVVLGILALVVFLLARQVVRLMHGVE